MQQVQLLGFANSKNEKYRACEHNHIFGERDLFYFEEMRRYEHFNNEHWIAALLAPLIKICAQAFKQRPNFAVRLYSENEIFHWLLNNNSNNS